MALVKNIKGTLVDIESLIPITVSFYREKLNIELKEKEYEPMATCIAYNLAKMKLFPKFNPFDCSLRKIYGFEFFDDKSEETPDFDGCILLRDAEIYHGDTDGDIPRIERYPFIVQDPVKMMEKILGNKKYETEHKARNQISKKGGNTMPNADFDDFEGIDDPDHEDRRKEWLENYAAEEAGYHPVESC